MKAVVVTALGDADVLRVQEMPEPEPSAGEVLIEPLFIGVNYADIKARRGSYHGAGEPPFIPGLDVAGRVVGLGAGVSGFQVGEIVTAATTGGAYARLVRARQELCFALPEGADPAQSAALIVLMTAHNLLVWKGALQPGETVLVHGAAGGVGTVLLQLARHLGAGRLIAAVGSAAKREVAESYGADTVIVGRGPELSERLRQALPDGADLILDPVAGEQFEAGVELLKPFGRMVVYGNSGGQGRVSTAPLHSGNRSVIGYSSGHYIKHRPAGVRDASVAMLELLAAGHITVPVSRVYPLEEAAEAHRFMESRASTGKLLLEP